VKGTPAIPSGPEGIPQQEPAPVDASGREKPPSRRALRGIPRLADRQAPPLSFAQERLWLLDQLEPGSPVYNRLLALRLRGLLDAFALRQALQTIIDRHEVLRARFTAREGQPAQVISPRLAVDLRVMEFHELPPTQPEYRARQVATEEALRPFDLARGPILRATLLRLGDQEHVLLLVFHHIAFDAWSARVFVDELTSLYRASSTGTLPALAEIPIQYSDFAHWQRQRVSGELLERQLLYWKQQLRGCVPVILPTDRPRPSLQSHRGGCTEILLPEPFTDSLKALGRRESATLFMVLLAAFQALLSRYTGSVDIAVGSPVAGRNWVETEKLIGIFINLLVLRTNLAGNPTFRELLGRVRETSRGAYSHQDLPFEKLVEALRPERDLSTTPLFQVMFNLENLPEGRNEVPGLRIDEFESEVPVAAYDLTLEIVPGGRQLRCSFVYNSDLFDSGTMERMAAHYRTLLEGIVADPDGRVATLPLLTPAERHQTLVEWNRTEAEYPRDATIPELFEAQVERTPGATAFIGEGGSVSYRDLNRQANQIARCLRSLGARPESFVGLCLDRSLQAVAALLGILKAGAAFVPLDPTYPRDRLAFMIADARLPIVLSRRKGWPMVRHHGARVVCLDSDRNLIEAQGDENLPSEARPTSVAYLLYTSGSTGEPRGVLGLHRGALNRFAWMWRNFPFGPSEVGCQKTSWNFVDSLWEIFGPLLRGIPNVIIPDQTVRDPDQLVQALASQGVTRIVTVPSLLRVVLDRYADLGDRLPLLKLWVSSGEALLPDLCRRFHLAMPNATLLNLYGSTEVSADVTAYVAGSDPQHPWTVPLGRPIDNTRLYALDGQLQPVPIGVPGELYVGGDGLARGYWNRPEITARLFIADRFGDQPEARLYRTGDRVRYLPTGNLQFLGRADNQVKVRGFRVELEEIETVLAEHPAVSAAAVVAREESAGEKRLVAYIVPRHSTTLPTSKTLRDFLKKKLPDYMVPSDFVTVEALPLTPNGKVDRRALPTGSQPRQTENRYIPPRDLLEWQLAGIWEQILSVRPIGIEHDFFDLGGHSLLAVRMMDRIEDACCQRLPLSTLMAEATIKHLAECLRAECPKESQSGFVPVQPRGARPPFFFLHAEWTGGLYCRKLARLLGPEQPFYGLMPNGFDGKPLLPSVEAMAAENIRHLVALQPRGPYLLGGFCNGGFVAYEMARQMEQQGLQVGLVILLDAAVPRCFGWLKTLIRYWGWLARLDADEQIGAYSLLRKYLIRVQEAWQKGRGALIDFHRQTVWKELRRRVATRLKKPSHATPVGEDSQQALRELRFAGVMMNYRPKPFPGRVVLLRTKSLDRPYPTDRTAGWGKVVSQLQVHEVPGDHMTLLVEQIGAVAEHMGSCLRAFHADARGESTHGARRTLLAKSAPAGQSAS
jgi:amino acid adenylation domain-containing protein